MKSSLLILYLSLFAGLFAGCGSPRRLHTAERSTDSSYIYELPFEAGRSYFVIQSYRSRFSHRGILAIDFKMRRGRTVCAARGGVVVFADASHRAHGTSMRFFDSANRVVIRHADGSAALYGHLNHGGALVKRGQKVTAGQAIARSGHTGYSATPHLHFAVLDREGRTLPTRFRTRRGVRYLRAGRWYRRIVN